MLPLSDITSENNLSVFLNVLFHWCVYSCICDTLLCWLRLLNMFSYLDRCSSPLTITLCLQCFPGKCSFTFWLEGSYFPNRGLRLGPGQWKLSPNCQGILQILLLLIFLVDFLMCKSESLYLIKSNYWCLIRIVLNL